MTKINSSDRIVWLATSDEGFPPGPWPSGSALIYLDTGHVQFVKNNTWSVERPLLMTMDIPFDGIPDSITIPGPSGGSANRQVVALGSNISLESLPGVETLLIRLEQQLGAVLTELRTQNIMLNEAFSGLFPSDDLDNIRAGVLAAEETIVR